MYKPTPPADLAALEAEIFTLLMWRDRVANVIEEKIGANVLPCDRPLTNRIATRTATDAIFAADYLAELDTVLARARAALDDIWRPDVPAPCGDGSDIHWESVPQTDEAWTLNSGVSELAAFRESAQKLQVLRRTPLLAAELRHMR